MIAFPQGVGGLPHAFNVQTIVLFPIEGGATIHDPGRCPGLACIAPSVRKIREKWDLALFPCANVDNSTRTDRQNFWCRFRGSRQPRQNATQSPARIDTASQLQRLILFLWRSIVKRLAAVRKYHSAPIPSGPFSANQVKTSCAPFSSLASMPEWGVGHAASIVKGSISRF